jgi:hypothetical protein
MSPAGGSIAIDAYTISGNGTMRVNGGAAGVCHLHGTRDLYRRRGGVGVGCALAALC